MEPALTKIAAWDYSQPRDALYEFDNFLRASTASGTALPRIESRLIEMLTPGTTLDGRDYVCRQLSLIGTAASVPVLSAMLGDSKTTGMARYALERIPAAEAADALRNALPKMAGTLRAGIIESLGARRDAKSVPLLKSVASGPDAAFSDAALAALASIGNAPALAAIGEVRRGLSGNRRGAASRAYIRCADTVAPEGGRAAALSVYRQLSAPAEPPMIRIAALTGLAAANGKAAVPLLSKEVASAHSEIQAAAIRLLSRIPGSDVTATLAKQYPAVGPMGQVRLLAVLGERGDPAARPVATEAVKSPTVEVRAAALAALGRIGDPSSVPLLAQTAANTQGEEQAAARQSLASLGGAGVDAAIVAAIDSSSGKTRLELVRAAGDRASTASAGALMRVAQGADREAARESIRALRYVAGPAQAPPLIEALGKARDAAERREISLTLAAVIGRAPHPDMAPVLAAYQSVTDAATDRPFRLALIDLMGQVSAGEALPVLRAGLQDANQEIARAAILALTAWQTPDPLVDLFAVAKNDSNATRQILALRGVIRLIGVPSSRSTDETVTLLSETMQLAKQTAEKRAILALLPNYPTAAALRMAEAAVKDDAVTREAQAAVDNIRALGIR